MVSTQLDSYFGIIEERVPPEGYDDIVVLGTTESSFDNIVGFTGGSSNDIIKLGGADAAVAKTVAQVTAQAVSGNATESAAVTFPDLASTDTFTLAGRILTGGSSGATAIEVAAAFASGTTNGTKVTVSGTLTGYTAAASGTPDNKNVLTSTTADTNVTDLAVTGTPTLTGTVQTVAITVTPGSAGTVTLYAGVANEIVFDTAANLGDLGVNIGDVNGAATAFPIYAVASDTGAIYYDSDGDWTSGAVKIGAIGVVTGLTAGIPPVVRVNTNREAAC